MSSPLQLHVQCLLTNKVPVELLSGLFMREQSDVVHVAPDFLVEIFENNN